MSKLVVMDHPLIQHKVSLMRSKDTSTKAFRELLDEVSMLMAYEVTRDLPLEDIEVETPICKCTAKEIAGKKLAVVPILRAGLGMVDGVTRLVPSARVGHIGLYRDPNTLEPVEYYCKLPKDIEERDIILLDPMLATGGSAVAAPVGAKVMEAVMAADAGSNDASSMGRIAGSSGRQIEGFSTKSASRSD